MNTHYGYMFNMPMLPFFIFPLAIIVIVWVLFWKGLALWNAAKRGHKAWFVVLLIVNTFGILEIIYLLGVLKIKISDLWKSFN